MIKCWSESDITEIAKSWVNNSTSDLISSGQPANDQHHKNRLVTEKYSTIILSCRVLVSCIQARMKTGVQNWLEYLAVFDFKMYLSIAAYQKMLKSTKWLWISGVVNCISEIKIGSNDRNLWRNKQQLRCKLAALLKYRHQWL